MKLFVCFIKGSHTPIAFNGIIDADESSDSRVDPGCKHQNSKQLKITSVPIERTDEHGKNKKEPRLCRGKQSVNS